MTNKIKCPLSGVIDDSMCFDISMVAEDLAPARTISKDILKIDKFKEICLKCEFHKN